MDAVLMDKKIFAFRKEPRLPMAYKVLWLDHGKKTGDIVIGDITQVIKEQRKAGFEIVAV